MTDLHTCEAEECDRKIARGLLMCLPHWRMVPAPLQRDVNAAWCKFRRARNLSAYRDYRTLTARAIAAVREKEIKRQLKRDSMGDTLQLE